MRHQLLRRSALLASALALSALLASPAAAQRRTEWQVGVNRGSQHGQVGVTIGSRGVELYAGQRDRGRRPVYERCPPQPAGRWETRCEEVWIPGACRKVWVPPVYATRYDHCGRPYQVEVRCGFWDTIQEQGHFEHRETRVWVSYQHGHGRAITAR